MEDNKNNAGEQTADNKDVQNSAEGTKDVKEEAKFTQAEFDEALRKEVERKTKNLPSKEDLKAFNDWKETQKTAEQKKQEEIDKVQRLEADNSVQSQMLEIMKKGISYDDAEFIQFKVSKMGGEFSDNLETYLKNNNKYSKKEEKKNETTGFSQNNNSQGASEEKAYLDKKYANNPYYKK